MGGDLLGSIPGSNIPQTSSLEPQAPLPYSVFPSEELAISHGTFNPDFNTCKDDVGEWF
jgi:hypothetical protein